MHHAAPATVADPGPLALPPRAPEPARAGFPWIASAAPVAGAVVIWSVTGSAFALVFAALGPLVALASMLDARRHASRERRRSSAERERLLARLHDEIGLRHDLERAAAWRGAPGVRGVLARPAPGWRSREPERVVIGSAGVVSRVRVDGVPSGRADEEVLAHAALLDDAPVTAVTAAGVGFTGPRALALAAARSAVVQCADAAAPGALAIDGPPGADWAWITSLPHADLAGTTLLAVSDAALDIAPRPAPPGTHVLAVAPSAAELPPGLGTVVQLREHGRAVVLADGAAPVTVVPELASAAEAAAWGERMSMAARRAGLDRGDPLPQQVELSGIAPASADPADRSTLRVPVGVGASGVVELDVAAGPHALVAGTSGSGKSEFLVTWITSLAIAHPPDRVAFLLVDFKGGAAFEPVADLPQVTGIVTDLAEGEAGRAVASIRAELRHRELALAAAGARDIANLPVQVVLPRLVVVVDEFQAMVERFPDLGAVIADVAARGRSLGVHLVLASQRPNGVVRENVTANCGIRVSLRVLQRADSVAVVGTGDAASIDVATPGRGVADRGDGGPLPFQSAIADAAALRLARERHRSAPPPRRPWLDPLPAELRLDTVREVLGPGSPASRPGTLLLGAADDPSRQRRVPIEWHPDADGPLAVLGARGSGRTALLDALAEQVAAAHGDDAVLRVEGARSAAWDALEQAACAVAGEAPVPPRLLVLDDVDARFAGWPDDARFAALGRLEAILRGARAVDVAVAVSATRLAGLGAAARDALSTTVLLRHATRADVVQAGGDGGLWEPEAPAGSGQWRGLRAQFLAAARPGASPARAPERFVPGRHPLTAICSATPRADADAVARSCPGAEVVVLDGRPGALARAGSVGEADLTGRPLVFIGDAESWSADWALVAHVRSRGAVVVVHGSPADYRALARETGPPPLLDDHRRQCWEIPPEHRPIRRSWIE